MQFLETETLLGIILSYDPTLDSDDVISGDRWWDDKSLVVVFQQKYI
jgi:hypothetical protein